MNQVEYLNTVLQAVIQGMEAGAIDVVEIFVAPKREKPVAMVLINPELSEASAKYALDRLLHTAIEVRDKFKCECPECERERRAAGSVDAN